MKKLLILLLTISMCLCFAACGNSSSDDEVDADEVYSEEAIEPEDEIEEAIVEVPWQTLEETETTLDGYEIIQKVKVSPLISSDDSETLQSVWEQVGGEGSYPVISDFNANGVTRSYDYDEILYAFGTAEAINNTEGFSITSDIDMQIPLQFNLNNFDPNPGDVHFDKYVPFENSMLHVFFSNGEKSYDYNSPAFSISMSSDHWGPVPFVYAIQNHHTPNEPDGDPITDNIHVRIGSTSNNNVKLEKFTR